MKAVVLRIGRDRSSGSSRTRTRARPDKSKNRLRWNIRLRSNYCIGRVRGVSAPGRRYRLDAKTGPPAPRTEIMGHEASGINREVRKDVQGNS